MHFSGIKSCHYANQNIIYITLLHAHKENTERET